MPKTKKLNMEQVKLNSDILVRVIETLDKMSVEYGDSKNRYFQYVGETCKHFRTFINDVSREVIEDRNN